jgi:spore coat polysaccharide biosynthesis protein SpsF
VTSDAVAIVQARMGSSRLPGKVLLPLGTRSLLGHLVERLAAASRLDRIVVATTTLPEDNPVADEADRLGVCRFRGAGADVLRRYVDAARAFDADIVVRVTADNPLTDYGSVDRVVDAIRAGYDYAVEEGLPVGVTGEALSIDALRFLDIAATTPLHREHVTLYAKENPQLFRSSRQQAPGECRRPDLRWTVDTHADYAAVGDLCARLPNPRIPLQDILGLADRPVVV